MINKTITFLLLFFVFSFLFRTDHSFDQDLGRHLKLGEIITGRGLIAQQTWQVPKVNLFSYTNPDFPFINTHWFFEVIAYFFSQTVGLQAFLFLKIIILLLSVWLIFKIIPKQNQILLFPIGFIFIHVLRERLELRPEIFSFFFTAITYLILEASLKAKRTNLLFILPLIQLIWINTHIYFFVGLILQAIFLLHLDYQYLRFHFPGGTIKVLTLVFVLSILASLINPNGINGLLYPLNVNTNYGYTIVENQTIFLLESINFKDPNFLFVKLSWGIILLSIIIGTVSIVKNLSKIDPSLIAQDDRGESIKNILLSVFGMSLSLLNVRSIPYLVFLSLPPVLQSLGPIKKNKFTFFLSFVTGVLLILESFFYLNGDYYKYTSDNNQPNLSLVESGKKAMDFVNASNLSGPVFNNFDIGSYIIYRSYPRIKVFVDGRPEGYPKEFFQETYIPSQYDYTKFKGLDKKFSFQTIIFSHTDQTPWAKAFLQQVVKDKDWKIVYIDDFMIVLVKNEVAEGKHLTIINLGNLEPGSYQFNSSLSYLRLGLFLLGTENIEAAKKFIEKTLQLFPDSPIANSLIGNNPKNNFFW